MNSGNENSGKARRWHYLFPVIALFLMSALSAYGNPVITAAYELWSFSGFVALVLPCLGAEAVVVGSLLGLSGFSTRRIMAGYMLTNVGVYCLIFNPLQQIEQLPVIVSEAVATLADAACIKVLDRFEYFSGDGGESISWRKVCMIAAIGNAVSYFVPHLISFPAGTSLQQ